MKLLLVDFMRRWWGLYLLIFLAAGLADALMMSGLPHSRGGFLMVGFFAIPWWFDLARGFASVTTTLPLSRKALGLHSFFLAVCLPVILLLSGIVVAQVFSAAIVFSWTDFVFVTLGALLMAAASCVCFSVFAASSTENSMVLGTIWAIYLSAFIGSMAYHKVENLARSSWICLGFVALGLPVIARAFVGSEKLMITCARNRPGSPSNSRKAVRSATISAFHLSGPFGLVVERFRGGFVVALIFALFIVVGKWKPAAELTTWMGLFIFAGFCPWRSGLRLLRTLPLSTNQFALWLLLEPLCFLAALFLVLVAVPVIVPWGISPSRVASLLILVAGAGSLVNGFMVGFGLAGGYISMVLFMLFFVAASSAVPKTGLPAIIGWLFGLALFCLGFFLMKHWLRSSASYQPRKATILS